MTDRKRKLSKKQREMLALIVQYPLTWDEHLPPLPGGRSRNGGVLHGRSVTVCSLEKRGLVHWTFKGEVFAGAVVTASGFVATDEGRALLQDASKPPTTAAPPTTALSPTPNAKLLHRVHDSDVYEVPVAELETFSKALMEAATEGCPEVTSSLPPELPSSAPFDFCRAATELERVADALWEEHKQRSFRRQHTTHIYRLAWNASRLARDVRDFHDPDDGSTT